MNPKPNDARDAARYRWLREQHWDNAPMCVVMRPREAVKLGYDCPSLGRLDKAIDDAMGQAGGDDWVPKAARQFDEWMSRREGKCVTTPFDAWMAATETALDSGAKATDGGQE